MSDTKMMKKLPISNSRYRNIVERNLAYVDKTEFIEKLYNSAVDIPLFLRPRRFGKTLFTEILFYYYDKAAESFADELFRGKYIYEHPVPYKNSYCVLKFDFSGIDTVGTADSIVSDFAGRIRKSFIDFYRRYPELLPYGLRSSDGGGYAEAFDVLYADLSPARCLDTFLKNFSLSGTEYKIMVIIDEYDNFTNDILSRDPELFEKLANKQGLRF